MGRRLDEVKNRSSMLMSRATRLLQGWVFAPKQSLSLERQMGVVGGSKGENKRGTRKSSNLGTNGLNTEGEEVRRWRSEGRREGCGGVDVGKSNWAIDEWHPIKKNH